MTGDDSLILRGDTPIPPRRLRLLYISDKYPEEMNIGHTLEIRIDILGGVGTVVQVPPDDPSTIFTRLEVRRPRNADAVPAPDYYPSYATLSPEQKWTYLSWLRDTNQPIHIGYVFVYYYGLERHLLVGEYASAFDEILSLRKTHKNRSFMKYGYSALLCSCILRDDPGGMTRLHDSGSPAEIGCIDILAAFKLSVDLSADNVLDISYKHTYGLAHRRFIRKNRHGILAEIKDVLKARFGAEYFPFSRLYHVEDAPKTKLPVFANHSFPNEVGTPALPDFEKHSLFISDLTRLTEDAVERVRQAMPVQTRSK